MGTRLQRVLTQHPGRAAETGQENHGPYLLRVVWALAALSTLLLGLRVYCKLSRCRRLWWDDYVLIAAWVSAYDSHSPLAALASWAAPRFVELH
jgi:hypothetical protein